VSTADEGDTVTFTVNTDYYSDGSTLYYDITGSGITTNDFTDSTLSGSFTITNDSGIVTKTITEDNTTEGTETFTFNVRSGSTSGTILESTTVTINDTSVTPSFTTDTTYGTLVGAFEGYWGSSSYTTGIPQISSSNVIVSNSDFQSIRSQTTSNRVYYVWGSSQEKYVAFSRSEIESSADDVQAPTNTINPDNFGLGPSGTNRTHWWDEITGFSGSGSDYSFANYRLRDGESKLHIFDFGNIKAVDTNQSLFILEATPKVWIFYK